MKYAKRITAAAQNAGIKGLHKDHGSLENQDSIDTFGNVIPRFGQPRSVSGYFKQTSMRLLTILVMLLPLKIWGQTSSKDTLTDNLKFKSIEQILKDSKNITSETFDLKFLLRVLPDNGWFLKLNKDSTFEYIHWSGWGETAGTILEKGKYSLNNNLLKLESEKKNSELENIEFYLLTAQSEKIDNNITIDCVKEGELIYCLFHR